MAVQLSTVKPGDVLYYPVPKHGYHIYTVVSVDPTRGTFVYTGNGYSHTGTQRNLNRFRRTPPNGR